MVSTGFSPSTASITVGLAGWIPFALTSQMFIYAQNNLHYGVSCSMLGPEALGRKHIICPSTQRECI